MRRQLQRRRRRHSRIARLASLLYGPNKAHLLHTILKRVSGISKWCWFIQGWKIYALGVENLKWQEENFPLHLAWGLLKCIIHGKKGFRINEWRSCGVMDKMTSNLIFFFQFHAVVALHSLSFMYLSGVDGRSSLWSVIQKSSRAMYLQQQRQHHLSAVISELCHCLMRFSRVSNDQKSPAKFL